MGSPGISKRTKAEQVLKTKIIFVYLTSFGHKSQSVRQSWLKEIANLYAGFSVPLQKPSDFENPSLSGRILVAFFFAGEISPLKTCSTMRLVSTTVCPSSAC